VGGIALALVDNPHRWEDMADIAAVGHQVVLTRAVIGHYDQAATPKSSRSTWKGRRWTRMRDPVAAQERHSPREPDASIFRYARSRRALREKIA
jgi:hypothetical protein